MTSAPSPSPAADPVAATVDRVVQFFETLQPTTLGQLADCYDPQVRFKDPFNDVVGLAAVERIFGHMFETLDAPRFVVTGRVVQGPQCFLTWDFHFRFRSMRRGQDQCIRGVSHLVISPAGLVTLHRDYWDAAEELYEKLPLVGSLMRWLKKQAG